MLRDTVIVGAGPAGAWAAYRLATAGRRVAIVDGSHPREKPCGGGVTGRALELIRDAIEMDALSWVRIDSASFTHDRRTAQVALHDDLSGFPPLVVAERREFDAALLSAAVRAGAELIPARATSVARHNGSWRIDTREGSLDARWLIGADGANSLVRRTVLRPFARTDLSIATGYFVRGRSSREIVVAFEDEPSGYLWSFPRADHLAIGICAQADESTSPALLARAARWVDTHVGPRADAERYSWPIPSLSAETLRREAPAGDSWMLVGDAAGLVDPITREGIFFALQSAGLAASALLAGQDPGAAYIADVRRRIYSELARAARLKARFFRPRFMDLLVSALERSGRIRVIMADLVAGRQTYDGLRRRLLRTLEWKLMLELFGS